MQSRSLTQEKVTLQVRQEDNYRYAGAVFFLTEVVTSN